MDAQEALKILKTGVQLKQLEWGPQKGVAEA